MVENMIDMIGGKLSTEILIWKHEHTSLQGRRTTFRVDKHGHYGRGQAQVKIVKRAILWKKWETSPPVPTVSMPLL